MLKFLYYLIQSTCGSNFNIGDTVYGFAVLQTGYNPGSGWTLVSGSTYIVGSLTVNASLDVTYYSNSSYDFR